MVKRYQSGELIKIYRDFSIKIEEKSKKIEENRRKIEEKLVTAIKNLLNGRGF